MDNETFRSRVMHLTPEATLEESGEWLGLVLAPDQAKSCLSRLRHAPEIEMDYLFCLTGVDWKTHFSLVYHLSSTQHRQTMVVKVKLDREQPEMDTVSDIWRTAEFHEREAYDLFGIRFRGHPDLRRLFLTEDWIGWPLRKDYEDPVNMIKL